VKRFQLAKSPTRFYTPTATRDFDFLEKVGFPGQYPFTAGNNPFDYWRAYAEAGAKMGVRPEYGGSGASIATRAIISEETARALNTPAMREILASQGLEIIGSSPASFGTKVNSEVAKWRKVIQEAGIKPE
jgi:alkylation response protein AidB-like acyl-CoA dehydrogenase